MNAKGSLIRRRLITVTTALVVVGIAACAADTEEGRPDASETNRPHVTAAEVPMKSAEEVQRDHEAAWMALPNIIGVGVGEQDGRPCLMVFASSPHAEHEKIPAVVEGYAVKVVVTGSVEALESPIPEP